ncbi:hypothetical protein NW764_016128 [Fusarium oxysporum]|nr:hypothetical protein NW764_016128 [Fusarium oxysporum]
MKLHCAQSDEAGEVYAVAKRCYAYMEANAIVSVKVLQAYLLVGLYEIAHAIYPAAYLTIGGCSRLGHALGIHDRKRAAQLMPTVDSWTESEEINRTWWGVIILDSQALQIHRTLRSFSTGITQQLESTQQTQLYTAAAICYSAEVAIYDNYSCAVLDDVGGVGIAVQLEMQEIALSRLREVCATVHLFGRQIAETIRAKGFLNISPLLADCLYQATRQMIWYVHDVGSSPDIEKLVDDNTETLQMLGRKWEVANQYLSILEAEKRHFDGV